MHKPAPAPILKLSGLIHEYVAVGVHSAGPYTLIIRVLLLAKVASFDITGSPPNISVDKLDKTVRSTIRATDGVRSAVVALYLSIQPARSLSLSGIDGIHKQPPDVKACSLSASCQ